MSHIADNENDRPFDIEEFKEEMAGYAEQIKRIGAEVKEKLESFNSGTK